MSNNPSQHHLPPEYGRVTDPERFRPLHAMALDLLDRAGRQYYVRRAEGYGVDVELEASLTLARATVVLAPYHAAEAAVAVAFTTFPGLHVRFGRWCCLVFPACGCDACGETAEDECNRFTSLAEDLIAGRFREAIVRSENDTAWYEWESSTPHYHLHRSPIVRDDLRFPLADERIVHHWRAWSRRHSEVS